MATLTFNGTSDYVKINPLSTSLNNIPNGACTVAALVRRASDATGDSVWGLRGSDQGGNFYHGLELKVSVTDGYHDDDNTVSIDIATGGPTHPIGTGGDNFCIIVIDWPAGGAALERFHSSGPLGSAESWGHANSSGNNAGNTSGPGTSTGFFHIGWFDGQPWLGDIALIGVWAGTRFDDTQVEALWTNKKTSDWYNHSAGTPDTLIELTSTSPTDIGADPVSSITVSGATAAGAVPTGWTFDGQGAGTPQTICPDSDITTTGWTTTPLWSKIGSPADATIITATAA